MIRGGDGAWVEAAVGIGWAAMLLALAARLWLRVDRGDPDAEVDRLGVEAPGWGGPPRRGAGRTETSPPRRRGMGAPLGYARRIDPPPGPIGSRPGR